LLKILIDPLHRHQYVFKIPHNGGFIFGRVFDQLKFLRQIFTGCALRVDGSEAENAHDVTSNRDVC
jgi:hypothetical protein